jgi:hypothetical protein
MKLQEFIKETLIGIVRGIEQASAEIGEHASINPKGTYVVVNDGVTTVYYSSSGNTETHMTLVRFDVAVTAEEKNTGSGGGGGGASIGVLSFKVGVEGEHSVGSGSISRLEFSIPVLLPQGAPPVE